MNQLLKVKINENQEPVVEIQLGMKNCSRYERAFIEVADGYLISTLIGKDGTNHITRIPLLMEGEQ